MQIAILGPLEVRDDAGQPIEIAGARLRALLARLALDAGQPVGVELLSQAVWGARPPTEQANALQTLVSRLRRALNAAALDDAARIVASHSGYCLAVEPDDIDLHRFFQLAAAGAETLGASRPAAAARLLADAVRLWRGPAAAPECADAGALGDRLERLTQRRIGAFIDRIEADLQAVESGDVARPGAEPAALVAELETLSAMNPLDERLTGLLMRALARAGRQADALHAYETVRTTLADELGVDPSRPLQELHLEVLRGGHGPAAPTGGRRSNLRVQLTSFVGRDDEVSRIAGLVQRNRLVTLVGAGGAGKTRLASEAAERILDTAPDGVWLVELASVTTAADVPGAVLTALGLREQHLGELRATVSVRDAMTRLTDGLADKRLVLVLDNCEHLIEESARLADQLLARSPGLRMLTTSREPLGIVGEVVLPVLPLGRPAPSAGAAEAMQFPAVRLFAERAAAVRPDFVVDDADAATVIEIVTRLDGLPLAIELAAARLRTMPLDEIASRLSDRFRLLTGGSRTALARHRTLRAVVDWSWDLLTPDERGLAEQLSVFPAGVTATSAAAVSDLEPWQVPDMLASLADKSLLQPVDGGRRMRMLETIREYGAERLAERGELDSIRARHATHFSVVVAEVEPTLFGAEQLPTFALFTDERDNMLAAMRYLGAYGDVDAALRLALSLGMYAMMLGAHAELAVWLGEALAFPGESDPVLRLLCDALRALNSAASGLTADTEHIGGQRELGVLARALGDVEPDYWPLVPVLRAVLAFFADEPELCQRYLTADLGGAGPWAVAVMGMFRAMTAENNGDLDGMRVHTLAALEQFRTLGERWGLAGVLRSLGQLRTLDGDLDGAVEAYREVMTLHQQLHTRDDEGFLLGRLAELELRRGDLAAARRYAVQAQASAEAQGELMERVFTASMLATVEHLDGHSDAARAVLSVATRQLRELPMEHPALGHVRSLVLATDCWLHAEDGDLSEGRKLGREALSAALGTWDRPLLATVAVALSSLTAAGGEPALAAEVLGAAAGLRGADDPTDRHIADLTDRLRADLGAGRFEECYAAGKALNAQAATELLAGACAS